MTIVAFPKGVVIAYEKMIRIAMATEELGDAYRDVGLNEQANELSDQAQQIRNKAKKLSRRL